MRIGAAGARGVGSLCPGGRFPPGASWIHRGRVLPDELEPTAPGYAEATARAPEVSYDCPASPIWERGRQEGHDA